MEPIRKWHEDEMEKRQNNSDLLIGMQKMTDAITKGNKEMCNVFKDRPNKLVKPAKVPSWSKGMKLDVYVKTLEVWMEMNKDVSEAVRYQDISISSFLWLIILYPSHTSHICDFLLNLHHCTYIILYTNQLQHSLSSVKLINVFHSFSLQTTQNFHLV